ncbi:MAG: NAD(P)/FAD-dependent oxidoreductase [Candidatus Zixiibacteriota bacterium]|jgi:digeranylgeranylglycerophospholipid reductase
MPDKFDVAVIGAGPAGLMAASEAARAGASVLLLEKDDQIGEPLNCAEGVTRLGVEQALPLRDEWIRTHPFRGRLISPSGHVFEMHHLEGGYILDRVRMERDLALEFEQAGGTLRLGCRAIELSGSGENFTQLKYEDERGAKRSIGARIFVAADGIEGTISRLAGLDNRLNLTEMESFLQYHIEGAAVETDAIEVYLGRSMAPGSYAWIFPRGDNQVSVGLGILLDPYQSRPVKQYLDRFVERRFGTVRILRTSCGTSPRYAGPGLLAKGNLLVVGDAARIVDALTGAGIVTALLSGKIAGEAAGQFVSGEVNSIRELHDIYPRRFLDRKHAELTRLVEIKKLVCALSDGDLDEMVLALRDYFGDRPVESVNIVATIAGMVRKRPRLLKLARHLL